MTLDRIFEFAWSVLVLVAFVAMLVSDGEWQLVLAALGISLLYSIRADIRERTPS